MASSVMAANSNNQQPAAEADSEHEIDSLMQELQVGAGSFKSTHSIAVALIKSFLSDTFSKP